MKHVLGFSGGADSQAVALWLRQRYPAEDVILTNADPGGNEHPMTTEFIAWYSEHIHPVITIVPQVRDMLGRAPRKIYELALEPTEPLTFDLLALVKGCYPSTRKRFCTTHLKLEPMRRWCYENGARGLNPKRSLYRDGKLVGEQDGWYGPLPYVDGMLSDGYERYAGVRRDESASRANVDEREYDDYFMCWLNRPISTWTKTQVFEFLAGHGEPVNPLYKLGLGRVGCAPCVNSGKEDIRLWAAHFPEMIDKVRGWERRVGKTFFPPCIPTGRGGRRHGFVDEVVEWAKTVHGGSQYELPLLEADIRAGFCMSKYGLCE